MGTKDGYSQIWYADANGIVTGYTPNADNIPNVIIDAYNEHFGTDIAIWTPETITLQVGDTVPNWNAYEKILLSLAEGLYKFDVSEGANAVFAAMNFQSGTMSIYSSVKDEILKINIYNPQGNFIGPDGNENIMSAISEICSKYSNVQTVNKVNIGTNNLENFENFSVIS